MSIENNILKWIQYALSPVTILFRNNSGTAVYPPKSPEGKPMYVKYGIGPDGGGGSDSIGWTSRLITADMVGQKVAIFTAMEIKTLEGDATDEQRNFIKQVKKAGGLAGFASTREDARKIQNQPLV